MSRDIYVYSAFLATIALTACLAPPAPLTAAISELSVLLMLSLLFSASGSSRAAAIAEFSLKIVFVSLCAKSGGVLPHAAALLIDGIFEKLPG